MSKSLSVSGMILLITLATLLSCSGDAVTSHPRDETIDSVRRQDGTGTGLKRSATRTITLWDASNPHRLKLEPTLAAESASPAPFTQAAAVPSVDLRAASGATIGFETQNGETLDGVPPQTMDLPHLVLYRNGALVDPEERTLIVGVTGIDLPPAGVTVTLELETQHRDPDLDGDASKRITVLRESRLLTNTLGFTQTDVTLVFAHEFTATVVSGTETIPTPTDYFRYHLAVTDQQHPISRPLFTFGAEYAFLMENQWTAPLPAVREASAGAAPDELIVYYCDMFPFRESAHDRSTWLPRKEVTDYIGAELLPQMVQAFRTQTDGWGFPWYDEWTSWRRGEDADRLSVALTDGRTWFHGWAPFPGHSGISINVNGGRRAYYYDTLADAVMSTFHHEVFHNLQRSIDQHNGGRGDVSGADDAWRFFSEGTAVLASSVGQARVQFSATTRTRDYMFNANSFLGAGGSAAVGLNKSYAKLEPYYAALYWRFLYESCGGMRPRRGVDQAAGMQVIRDALTVLYGGDIVDIGSSNDLVGRLPQVVDQALEAASCPFKTHRGSLAAFARAIYALRLEGGRCRSPGIPGGCGLYDPHGLYRDPPVSAITYTGAPMMYDARHQPLPSGIPSSYGIDFVDVVLDPATDGRSLVLEFYGAPGSDAAFDVQLWKLKESGGGARRQRLVPHAAAAEILTGPNADGHVLYVIPAIDRTEYSRIGLIITRVDRDEGSDSTGEYTIVLQPNAESPSDAR